MNKTIRNNIIIAACVLAAFLVIVGVLLSGRVAENPEGTVGNTAGNLLNEGLFCEYDGTVYFSNTSHGGALYAMNPDETNMRRLNSLKVRNILAGGKYLYFFQTGAADGPNLGQIEGIKNFNRSRLNGKDVTIITRDTVLTGQLVDNHLYLLTSSKSGVSLQKIKTDKSEQVKLTDWELNPACAVNGQIYYHGVLENHYLYALNTQTDVTSEVWRGNICYPILDGDYVYYMDVEKDYRLCRYSLSRNEIQVLTNDRVDCYNMGNGYIYYQKNGASPQLMCMYTDGSNLHPVADGNFTHINMTSNYVYFQEFGREDITYHSPLGSSTYSEFLPE